MAKQYSLNLFFDSSPDRDFVRDFSNFEDFNEEEITKLVDLVLDWYTKKEIDKEWQEWS